MEKLKKFFFIPLLLLASSLNAQVFIGGDIGFSKLTDKYHNGGMTQTLASNSSLNLSPYAGKFLSDKFAAGFSLDISISRNTTGNNPVNENNSTSFGGDLFARYYAIKWNKFSVFGQGKIGPSFSNSVLKNDGVITNETKSTALHLSIYPGISYDLNDRLSFQTSINVLSLNYTYIRRKTGSTKEDYSFFNIGAGLDNIVTFGDITIGAIYKFPKK